MFSNLVTPRLVLRRLDPSDAEAVYAYRSDPEVSRFQSWAPASVLEIRSFIERMSTFDPLSPGEWFQLGIILAAEGKLVGDCGLQARADDRRQVEVGITVAPAFQRLGIAVEALTAVFGYLFTNTETHRVFCSVDPGNDASLNLLKKIGMRREGHMRECLWVRGKWVDDVAFGILRKEWEGRDAQP